MQVQIVNCWIGYDLIILMTILILTSIGGVLPAPDCLPCDHDEHDNHGDQEEVEGYVRRLEGIHKEVRGCLISSNLELACIKKLEVI